MRTEDGPVLWQLKGWEGRNRGLFQAEAEKMCREKSHNTKLRKPGQDSNRAPFEDKPETLLLDTAGYRTVMSSKHCHLIMQTEWKQRNAERHFSIQQ